MTSSDVNTWGDLLTHIASCVGDAREARFICEHVGGMGPEEFAGSLSGTVSPRMQIQARALADRRGSGEPLQYVLGCWAFRHLDLLIDRRVLIPRPETEQVAEAALRIAAAIAAPRVVVDLGTGSGAIGLSLAYELPINGTSVWLTDASSDALDVARANLAGIGRPGENVRLSLGDWFTALPGELRGSIDVIVSNPPYIADNDPEIERQVVDYEPSRALFSGADGLDALRTIIDGAPDWLRDGGAMVLEIGHRQGDAVRSMLASAGFHSIEIRKDHSGRDRIAVGLIASHR